MATARRKSDRKRDGTSGPRARGFADKCGFKQGDRAFSMRCNEGARQCLNVVVRDGRVARPELIAEENCL